LQKKLSGENIGFFSILFSLLLIVEYISVGRSGGDLGFFLLEAGSG